MISIFFFMSEKIHILIKIEMLKKIDFYVFFAPIVIIIKKN
jgi:hypothetical protein